MSPDSDSTYVLPYSWKTITIANNDIAEHLFIFVVVRCFVSQGAMTPIADAK